MPRRGATGDGNHRPPLGKGGLQGGGANATSNLPLTPPCARRGCYLHSSSGNRKDPVAGATSVSKLLQLGGPDSA